MHAQKQGYWHRSNDVFTCAAASKPKSVFIWSNHLFHVSLQLLSLIITFMLLGHRNYIYRMTDKPTAA